MDQRLLPLDNSYTPQSDGSGVHVYVIDTGVLTTHTDFGGRASSGWDFVDNDADATDCNGHGTHVAGTIGGATFGVAKAVQIVGVRVLGAPVGSPPDEVCGGSAPTSTVIAGVDWVTANAVKPAVVNMSLGGWADDQLDAAVQNSINAGITYSLSAGNDELDACLFSPGRVAAAITVGAVDKTDTRPFFSNDGPCVDIHAPGVGITSAWPFDANHNPSTTGSATLSGTSMASPHVAGIAAQIAGEHPSYTPQQIRDLIVDASTSGEVNNPGPGTYNRMIYGSGRAAALLRVVRLRAHADDQFVTAPPNGAGMIANRNEPLGWETYDAIDDGSGNVALRARSNGKYVSASASGTLALAANRTVVGPWEQFTIQHNGDGSISFKAQSNGKFVTAENAGKGFLLNNRTTVGGWEEFDEAFAPSVVSLYAFAAEVCHTEQTAPPPCWVTADPNGLKGLIANRTQIGAWEEFDLVDHGRGTSTDPTTGWFALLAHANGKFVTADPTGSHPLVNNRSVAGAWERFAFVRDPDTFIFGILAGANGKYVTADAAGAKPLINNRTSVGLWEMFDLVG
jgi:hypothetical protein